MPSGRMAAMLAGSKTSRRSPFARRIFFAGAAGAMLFGASQWVVPRPIERSEVACTLLAAAERRDALDASLASFAVEIVSDERLAEACAAAGHGAKTPRQAPDLLRLRGQMRVQTQPRGESEAAVRMTLKAPDELWGKAMLGSLARQAAEQSASAQRLAAEREQKSAVLAAALESVAGEIAAQEAALAKLALQREQAQQQRRESRTAPLQTAPQPTPPAPEVENPAWRALQERHEALSRRRDELLVNLTRSHPLVQSVEQGMAEIEEQQRNTPRHVASPAPSNLAAAAPRLDAPPLLKPDGEEPALAAPEIAAIEKQLTEATAAAAALRSRHARQQAEWAALQATAPADAPFHVKVLEPPYVAERIEGARPLWQWAMMALISLGGGAGVAVAAGPRAPRDVLNSPEQVERALALPVISVLPR